MDIKSVLVCDAVDEACVNLLKEFDINVTYKLKMSPAELCAEVKVKRANKLCRQKAD